MIPGKDGKPFDIARYVDWATSKQQTLFKFEKFKKQKRVPKVACSKCFVVIPGRAMKKHKEICR